MDNSRKLCSPLAALMLCYSWTAVLAIVTFTCSWALNNADKGLPFWSYEPSGTALRWMIISGLSMILAFGVAHKSWTRQRLSQPTTRFVATTVAPVVGATVVSYLSLTPVLVVLPTVIARGLSWPS